MSTMTKWLRPIGILALVAIGLVAVCTPGYQMWSLVPFLVALVLAASGRSTLGTAPSRVESVPDARELKELRRRNPGMSISDALRHADHHG